MQLLIPEAWVSLRNCTSSDFPGGADAAGPPGIARPKDAASLYPVLGSFGGFNLDQLG